MFHYPRGGNGDFQCPSRDKFDISSSLQLDVIFERNRGISTLEPGATTCKGTTVLPHEEDRMIQGL
jgi:hypothetical protein